MLKILYNNFYSGIKSDFYNKSLTILKKEYNNNRNIQISIDNILLKKINKNCNISDYINKKQLIYGLEYLKLMLYNDFIEINNESSILKKNIYLLTFDQVLNVKIYTIINCLIDQLNNNKKYINWAKTDYKFNKKPYLLHCDFIILLKILPVLLIVIDFNNMELKKNYEKKSIKFIHSELLAREYYGLELYDRSDIFVMNNNFI